MSVKLTQALWPPVSVTPFAAGHYFQQCVRLLGAGHGARLLPPRSSTGEVAVLRLANQGTKEQGSTKGTRWDKGSRQLQKGALNRRHFLFYPVSSVYLPAKFVLRLAAVSPHVCLQVELKGSGE